MMFTNKPHLLAGILFVNTLNVAHAIDLDALDLEDLLGMTTELKADVGSRSDAANFLNSRAPLDVITYDQIQRTGYTSLVDVLRYFVAGFNAPENAISDGSDHVRGFTLRGMGSDQVLVLINGKRLHTSALLHVNSTVTRGSSNADLDTIAVNAIEKIEILRDGAAAQYGSDAISGVINIILKGMGQDNALRVHAGQRKEGDGERLYVDYFGTKALKFDGFINVALSAQKQQLTQRAGPDPRITPPEQKTLYGQPESQNIKLMINADAPQAQGHELYTKLQLNYRESQSGAFFRQPEANSKPVYPNGFVPKLGVDLLDYSVLFGVRGQLDNGTDWDFSNSYGQNQIAYNLRNSMNYSYGESSPTHFKNGELIFSQNTTNLDLRRAFGQLNLSGGLEYRIERYQIKAGDLASNVRIVNGVTSAGSQGFAGFTADNAINESRRSYAAYTELTYPLNDKTTLDAAARYENFSDFGDTANLKLSGGHYPIAELLLRSSFSTGFRAPALAQSHYSHTSTFTFQGSLEPLATLTTNNTDAVAYGASQLKPELSQHATIGAVFQPTTKTSVMLDYFYTKIEDRIMLSGDITDDKNLLANASGLRFFTNAVNTETQGFDFKLNHHIAFETHGDWRSGVWLHYAENKITRFNGNIITSANSLSEINRIEQGQPQSALRWLNSYEYKQVTTTLNITRHGEYHDYFDNQLYRFDARWITDLDISVRLRKTLSLSIGAHNLFDSTPNKWKNLTDNNQVWGDNGFIYYSRYSPFGFSGAYYYATARLIF